MTYKRKYKPSHTLWSLCDFEQCDSEWYEIAKSGRKMWHRSALESLQTRTLMNWIYGGDVIACVKADEMTKESEDREFIRKMWGDKVLKLIDDINNLPHYTKRGDDNG